MNLIGIAGKKGVGKDEVCNIIRSRLQNVKRIAFADALKDEVCRAMLISREYMEAHKPHFRLILQGWGTDYRRQMHGEDYWLRQWTVRIIRETDEDVTIVVPDVRFLNEARMVQELGGYVFHVDRPDYSEGSDFHQSENDLDKFTEFDRHIKNHGSLKQLDMEVMLALDMCHLLPTKQNTNATDDSSKPTDSKTSNGPLRTEGL